MCVCGFSQPVLTITAGGRRRARGSVCFSELKGVEERRRIDEEENDTEKEGGTRSFMNIFQTNKLLNTTNC